MKKILFVDDMEERHIKARESFQKAVGGVDVVSSYSASDAVTKLALDTFDVVSLDHDLASEHYSRECSADSGCGCDVVDYVCCNADKFTGTLFVVHSWNPDAAKRMFMALVEYKLRAIQRRF